MFNPLHSHWQKKHRSTKKKTDKSTPMKTGQSWMVYTVFLIMTTMMMMTMMIYIYIYIHIYI